MCLLPSASRRQLGVIHKDAAINLEQYQDQKLNDDFDDISGWLEMAARQIHFYQCSDFDSVLKWLWHSAATVAT